MAASTVRSTPGSGDEVRAQVDAVLFLETVADILQQQIVEIVAAELGVAVAGQDLDHSFLGLDDRYVEGAAAQIVDQHAPQFALAGIVGQGGGSRLIKDADDFEASQFAGFARGLALGVVEIGRHSDDRLAVTGSPSCCEARSRERTQDHRGDLLRAIFLIAQHRP